MVSNKAESLTLKNLHFGGGHNKDISGSDMCYAGDKIRPYNEKMGEVGGMVPEQTHLICGLNG